MIIFELGLRLKNIQLGVPFSVPLHFYQQNFQILPPLPTLSLLVYIYLLIDKKFLHTFIALATAK